MVVISTLEILINIVMYILPITLKTYVSYGIFPIVRNQDHFKVQASVVQRPSNTNPGLNFILGFFFFCSKAFSPNNFPPFLDLKMIKL